MHTVLGGWKASMRNYREVGSECQSEKTPGGAAWALRIHAARWRRENHHRTKQALTKERRERETPHGEACLRQLLSPGR